MIEAPVDHEYGHRDVRRVVHQIRHGIDVLAHRDAAGRQYRRLHSRLERENDAVVDDAATESEVTGPLRVDVGA
jgi:hypothetical protein